MQHSHATDEILQRLNSRLSRRVAFAGVECLTVRVLDRHVRLTICTLKNPEPVIHRLLPLVNQKQAADIAHTTKRCPPARRHQGTGSPELAACAEMISWHFVAATTKKAKMAFPRPAGLGGRRSVLKFPHVRTRREKRGQNGSKLSHR